MAILSTSQQFLRAIGLRLSWTFAITLACSGLVCSRVNAQQPQEYQVKAAFLLNFTKFIEWPPTAFADERAPLTICILGDDPFGGALNQIVEGEAVNGRAIAIQKIRRPPSPKSCQVLFISKSEKEIPKILAAVGPGVLTVGEGDTFLMEGGIVAFVLENRRVRFDVDQSAAAASMLNISSRLLAVARSVGK